MSRLKEFQLKMLLDQSLDNFYELREKVERMATEQVVLLNDALRWRNRALKAETELAGDDRLGIPIKGEVK